MQDLLQTSRNNVESRRSVLETLCLYQLVLLFCAEHFMVETPTNAAISNATRPAAPLFCSNDNAKKEKEEENKEEEATKKEKEEENKEEEATKKERKQEEEEAAVDDSKFYNTAQTAQNDDERVLERVLAFDDCKLKKVLATNLVQVKLVHIKSFRGKLIKAKLLKALCLTN
jgi:type IV secretory pathway VirB10-like protein